MHKKWWKFAIGVPTLLIFFGSLWCIKTVTTYNENVTAYKENQRLCKAIEATRHDVIKQLLNEGRAPNQQCKITYSETNNYSVCGRSWKSNFSITAGKEKYQELKICSESG
jgi:hypothetical protein